MILAAKAPGRWLRRSLATPGRRALGAALLIAAATAIVHGPALGHSFHYDDYHSIVHNPAIRSLRNVGRFFLDPALFSVNAESAMYRPMLLVSYTLNYAALGNGPGGFHAVNVLLHAANAMLVLALVLLLGEGLQRASLAAALFSLNPVNVEAVAYVSSRSELLMTFFLLGSCLAYGRWQDRRGSAWSWYGLSLVLGLGALLTKSVAAVLPMVLVLLDWHRGGRPLVWARRWAYMPFAVLVAGYVAVSGAVVAKAMLAPVRPWDVQLWTQIKAVVYYAKLMVMPVHLSVVHQFQVSRALGDASVLAALALVLSAAILLGREGGARRALRTGGAWFALCLSPSAAVPLVVLVNEHRLYLPGIGLSVAAAGLLLAVAGRRRPVAALIVAVYTTWFALLAFDRTRAWTDELTLWGDAAARAPLMVKPHVRLGDALAGAGRTDAAEAAYRRALDLRPQHVAARNNLGRLYLERGDLTAAAEQFRQLLAAQPDNAPARLNLAAGLLHGGDWQGARAEYERVLATQDNGDAHRNLGHIALRFEADAARALAHYDRALEIGGDSLPLVDLARGVALRTLGRPHEAEIAYRRALAADPALAEAWYNLGNLLMDQGQMAEAAAAFRRTVELDPEAELAKRALGIIEHIVP